MKLSRLTALEQDKITLDYKDLLNKIKEFQKILNDRSVLMDLIRNELSDIKKNFGDKRRTKFEELVNFSKEDLTKEEDLVVTLSNAGYVKAQPIHLYTPQKRGGRGKTAATVKDEDFIEKLFVANSHDTILCFSSLGKVYWLKVYDIPQSGRSAKGKAIVNILPLAQYEKITAIQKVSKYDENLFVLMATSKGVIKKTKLSDFSRPRSSGLIAINLKDGDNLIEVSITNGEKQIMLFSSAGKAIRFNESDVTCVGRSASGVKGITIDKDNNVISMITSNKDDNDDILIATENGYGKRTDINEFSLQKRSGKGNIAVKTSDRNGKVIGALKVKENDDLMLITDHGTLVRTSVKDIRQLGRNTQGVRLQTLNNNEKLSQIEKVEEEKVDDDKIKNEYNMSNDIKNIRKNIDLIDSDIVDLLNKRAKEAVNISKEKQKSDNSDNFYNAEREAQVIRRIKELNKGPLTDKEISSIYQEIMSACLSLEAPLKVSYLGPQGTYTQAATQSHFGNSILSVPKSNVEDVFSSVEQRESHYGVVPVENSTQGIVSSTLDMFMSSNLKISGEIEIPIHHNILSKSEKFSEIKKVYAHPQSFSQCKIWLEKNLPKAEKINASSNAEAALIASKRRRVQLQ